MIEIILDILAMDEWHGLNEEVDIAKGKYKQPMTFKEGIKNAKRWSRR